ncbi:MAG: DUF4234 domain-containing protein [Kiritimatiellae bacterium]|nr:DUF4234 domain-containing protein [Kiritimatiellia bacterium]
METPTATIQKRNTALYFILSIITCGIFGLYWFCTVNDDTNKVSGHPEATGGVAALLLTILTCGIYGLFWTYNMGTRIDEAKVKRGLPSGNLGMLYLILSLVGFGWVAQILMQSELNKLAE